MALRCAGVSVAADVGWQANVANAETAAMTARRARRQCGRRMGGGGARERQDEVEINAATSKCTPIGANAFQRVRSRVARPGIRTPACPREWTPLRVRGAMS